MVHCFHSVKQVLDKSNKQPQTPLIEIINCPFKTKNQCFPQSKNATNVKSFINEINENRIRGNNNKQKQKKEIPRYTP